MGRYRILPWRSISLTAVALILYEVFGPVQQTLVFDRAAIANGEVWRLVTGHWVHSDIAHLLWNSAALLLMGVLFERRLRSHVVTSLLAGTISVDIWLWWGASGVSRYCGLSGILNSLLIVGLIQLWSDQRHPLVPLVVLGAVTKIAIEIATGQALFTRTAWPSIPAAHAAGFLGGLGLSVLMNMHSMLKSHRVSHNDE